MGVFPSPQPPRVFSQASGQGATEGGLCGEQNYRPVLISLLNEIKILTPCGLTSRMQPTSAPPPPLPPVSDHLGLAFNLGGCGSKFS